MQRPMGVTILAVLAAIAGVLGIFRGLLVLGGSSAVSFAIPGFAGLSALIGIGAIVQSALLLVFVYGAWSLKPWAWMLGLVGAGLGVVVAVVQLGGSSPSSLLVNILIDGAIIYYLFQPTIRRAFGETA